jgi:translation initiation factor 2D
MAVHGQEINDDSKGKAVHILHTWQDHLWEMGAGGDPPQSQTACRSGEEDTASESAPPRQPEDSAPLDASVQADTELSDIPAAKIYTPLGTIYTYLPILQISNE